jgi:hypothetical protein
MTTTLDQIRAALAAASRSKDPAMAALYTAAARVVVERLRSDLDSIDALIRAREAELLRTAVPARRPRGRST